MWQLSYLWILLSIEQKDQTQTVLFSRALAFSDATNGKAVLQWQTGDLDVEAGNYEGELETVLSSGLRETRYELLKFKIREDFA